MKPHASHSIVHKQLRIVVDFYLKMLIHKTYKIANWIINKDKWVKKLTFHTLSKVGGFLQSITQSIVSTEIDTLSAFKASFLIMKLFSVS
jgi:hypothetical protein